MSKAYALSGLRCAYLCGPGALAAALPSITPPWVMGLAAQVAAVRALADPEYYARRYAETHALRGALQGSLEGLAGVEVIPGVANFLLVHLPPDGPDTAAVVAACRRRRVFLRDAGPMGTNLGTHALRVAVKSGKKNRKVVEALREAIAGDGVNSL